MGAGALGLATAWTLARRHRDVVVLDAAHPGHDGAGSRGDARILRGSYTERHYVEMAREARPMWDALERDSGRALLHRCGLLNFGDGLGALHDAMRSAGTAATPLSAAETRARFPGLAVDGPSLWERDAGVLAADACLGAFVETAPFTVRPDAAVRRVGPGDDAGAAVELADGGRVVADAVVICAGPSSLALLGDAPTAVAAPATWQQVVYLATPRHHEWPAFIEWGPSTFYGLPVRARGCLKLAQHVPATPRRGEDVPGDDPRLLEALRGAARRLLPGCGPEPVATERCLYDNTVDGDFVLDRVGDVVVGCGTSGHGFKFAPLLGEILADLATGVAPRIDVARFSLGRALVGGDGRRA